jgi:hypothetical protein
MYLYIPIDKRSIVVARHTISSTGMSFPERVAELDSVLGTLLDRHDENVTSATVLEPETVFPAVEEAVVPVIEEIAVPAAE